MRTLPLACLFALLPVVAAAQVPVERSFTRLPSSNGRTAILVELPEAKLTHFREHLFATEEPLLDADGNEVWSGNQPQVVKTRDLLYDAYFGLRSDGTQRWLAGQPVQLDASGYVPWEEGATGGTGIVSWRQQVGALELTSYAFAPWSLERAGFVMALRVRNTGGSPVPGVAAFSLHNFHLGFGRPGVMEDLGESGETIEASEGELLERAFAGVVVTRALESTAHRAAWNSGSPEAQNGYLRVANGGTEDLADVTGTTAAGTGWAHAFQFTGQELAPGGELWVGIVVAHDPDPFAGGAVKAALDGYVNGRGAKALLDAEVAHWAEVQSKLKLPEGLSADEEALLRHSAVVLSMAQVRGATAWLREHLTTDGEPRHTRFKAPGGGAATLPGTVEHRGEGAVLASLPPGEWTYAWIRDGAYAVAAMATLGMQEQARRGLRFYLDADSGRFEAWNELKPYGMPPYLITLTRYHGFGVEETDFNDFGPNLEFDGFGLFLWALRQYELATGDRTLADEAWGKVTTLVADPLVALVDPATGLIRKDSSIWESHWNGRERSWTYTTLTAVRGLCDVAALADARGKAQEAAKYRTAAEALRKAMAEKLTDGTGALASNLEELSAGSGHYDAAVADAIAMGLFDPAGKIAAATLDAFDAKLRVEKGPGWSRNDDRTDHAGAEDLSPWGGEYDSAEWVITDLRGAVAARLAGRSARADDILDWVTRQSHANFLAVAETYEEKTGRYKFNAPMVGFGAGAYVLALAQRATGDVEPGCGTFYEEEKVVTPPRPDAGSAAPDAAMGADAGAPLPPDDGGCGCATGSGAGGMAALLAGALALLRRARR